MPFAGEYEVHLNEFAIAELFRNPRGPVMLGILVEAGPIVARGARIRAPIRTGRLFDSISWESGEDSMSLYVSVYALFYDRFLEKPARQLKRARRPLRTALRDIPRIL